MITPHDYLGSAKRLLSNQPTEIDLRRAVSAAYYAMFHHLCRHFASIVIRPPGKELSRAWLQAYRHLDHGPAKQQCEKAQHAEINFPDELVKYAQLFKAMQERRNEADYNPKSTMTLLDAHVWIFQTERAIIDFELTPIEHQRAFVLFVCLRPKNR